MKKKVLALVLTGLCFSAVDVRANPTCLWDNPLTRFILTRPCSHAQKWDPFGYIPRAVVGVMIVATVACFFTIGVKIIDSKFNRVRQKTN